MQEIVPANHHTHFERYTIYALLFDGDEIRWCGTDSKKWALRDMEACVREWGLRADNLERAVVVDNNTGYVVCERYANH